jgi:hypothetical protein
MITVLCVRKDSYYKQLPVECYDKDRDAWSFDGQGPVICHPPCRQWGKYHAVAGGDKKEKLLALRCMELVRENGGVLEHPSTSKIWSFLEPGDRTVTVDLNWFGFPAVKRTTLLYAGFDIDYLPFEMACVRPVEHLSRKQRETTPPKMARWLVYNVLRCV